MPMIAEPTIERLLKFQTGAPRFETRSLKNELGKAVDVMRSIKVALDPQGLMNPGKIFQSSLEPRE